LEKSGIMVEGLYNQQIKSLFIKISSFSKQK